MNYTGLWLDVIVANSVTYYLFFSNNIHQKELKYIYFQWVIYRYPGVFNFWKIQENLSHLDYIFTQKQSSCFLSAPLANWPVWLNFLIL